MGNMGGGMDSRQWGPKEGKRGHADQIELDKLKVKNTFREQTQKALNEYQLTLLSEESTSTEKLGAATKLHLALDAAAVTYREEMAKFLQKK